MKKVIEIVLNILFWVSSTWIIVTTFAIESQTIEIINGVETIVEHKNIMLQNVLLVGLGIKLIMFYLNLFIITNKLKENTGLLNYSAIALLIIILFFLVEYSFTALMHSSSLIILPLKLNTGLYLFYFSVSAMYGFIKVWMKNEKKRILLEQEKRNAELSLLKAQLNPHFLFNILNNMLSMSQKSKNQELSNSINKLSDLMRYLLYEVQKNKVSLSKEIEFINDFIELNLLRYEKDELDISFNINGSTDKLQIEPGLLIPFVENAFKHGVSIEEKSYIKIELEITEEEYLIFEIRNSIFASNKNEENKTSGLGLKNIKERLEMAYKNNYELFFDETETEFYIKLKLSIL